MKQTNKQNNWVSYAIMRNVHICKMVKCCFFSDKLRLQTDRSFVFKCAVIDSANSHINIEPCYSCQWYWIINGKHITWTLAGPHYFYGLVSCMHWANLWGSNLSISSAPLAEHPIIKAPLSACNQRKICSMSTSTKDSLIWVFSQPKTITEASIHCRLKGCEMDE